MIIPVLRLFGVVTSHAVRKLTPEPSGFVWLRVASCQRKVEMSGFLPDRNVRFHGLLQGWFAGAWYLGLILFLGLGVGSASPGGVGRKDLRTAAPVLGRPAGVDSGLGSAANGFRLHVGVSRKLGFHRPVAIQIRKSRRPK